MNFLAALPDSTSPFKNFRSSDWPPLAVWCVRIRSIRSISLFNATIFSLLVVGWACA